MKTVLVDANILIRFLRKDNAELFAKAQDLFLKAEGGLVKIYLDEVVLAEVIWVLQSFYKLPNTKIADQLEKLIAQNWVTNPRKKELLRALVLFTKTNLHYIDCWIYTVSQSLKVELRTFDEQLKKMPSA